MPLTAILADATVNEEVALRDKARCVVLAGRRRRVERLRMVPLLLSQIENVQVAKEGAVLGSPAKDPKRISRLEMGHRVVRAVAARLTTEVGRGPLGEDPPRRLRRRVHRRT